MLDATALSADDGRINPAAALLRLQRCRRPADLPGLAAALFGALRQDGRPKRLLERLSDALMQMLVLRFGGTDAGERYTEEPCSALRHMEEPRMLAETVTRWRQEALDEGMAEGERRLLRRQATRRFGVYVGDALAVLLANEEDAERLAEVGELLVDCGNPAELLRRGGRLLNGRS